MKLNLAFKMLNQSILGNVLFAIRNILIVLTVAANQNVQELQEI